jgi:hypothetical protein
MSFVTTTAFYFELGGWGVNCYYMKAIRLIAFMIFDPCSNSCSQPILKNLWKQHCFIWYQNVPMSWFLPIEASMVMTSDQSFNGYGFQSGICTSLRNPDCIAFMVFQSGICTSLRNPDCIASCTWRSKHISLTQQEKYMQTTINVPPLSSSSNPTFCKRNLPAIKCLCWQWKKMFRIDKVDRDGNNVVRETIAFNHNQCKRYSISRLSASSVFLEPLQWFTHHQI